MVNLFLHCRILSLEVSPLTLHLALPFRCPSFSHLVVAFYPDGEEGDVYEETEKIKLTSSVALVVLASDSLEAVIPRYTSDQWKLLCFIVYVYNTLVDV